MILSRTVISKPDRWTMNHTKSRIQGDFLRNRDFNRSGVTNLLDWDPNFELILYQDAWSCFFSTPRAYSSGRAAFGSRRRCPESEGTNYTENRDRTYSNTPQVSKRWHMIFSCDTIIKPVLRQTLAFLGLDLEGITTDVAMANAMRYFRWQYGLQHARPVKKIFVPWPAQWPNVPDKVLYHSRRLCYILPYSNEVELFNLDTGERSNWTGSKTGLLHHFSISDRYLVMVSREM